MKEVTIEFKNNVELGSAIIALGNGIIEMSQCKYAEILKPDIEILKELRKQLEEQNY